MAKAEELPELKNWEEWLMHPCTKALRGWAREQRQALMEQWANGNFTASFDIEMAVRNAGATGACSIYAEVEEMDYQLIIEGGTDAEPKRT